MRIKRCLIPALSLSLVLGINLYLRSFTIYFPQLKRQAKNNVLQQLRKEASESVRKERPEFSPLAQERLIKQSVSLRLKQRKTETEKLLKEEYDRLKDPYQDKGNQTYLMEIDCWHWARFTENVLLRGHPGDESVNGKERDTLAFAPAGISLGWNHLIFYLSAFLYKAFSALRPVALTTFLFYLPLLFTAAFIAVLFLFCLRRWGNICAIVSCLFVGMAPIFLGHSVAGWFDMDVLNMLFPLLTVWAYFKISEAKSASQRAVWLIASSLCAGLFAFTWVGWWFILGVILLYEIYSLAFLGYARFRLREKGLPLFRQHIFFPLAFTGLSFLWAGLFSGTEPLLSLFSQVKGTLLLNKAVLESAWPNAFSTVEELRKANLIEIINLSGSLILFIPAACCLFTLFLRTLRLPEFSDAGHKLIAFLTIWFIVILLASSRGVRFILFALLPLGVSLGIVLSEAYHYFKKRNNKIITAFLIAFAVFLGFEAVTNGYQRAKTVYPLMDDNWNRVLTAIKTQTPPEAIINSWWDFGDWFKTVSGRRVIFDGQSQNTPQAHWMARALITGNEQEALSILRMLNNSGNMAFEAIDRRLNDPTASILLLKRLLALTRDEAREVLVKSFPADITDEIIKMLFSAGPAAYFVVDHTMPNKINAISYLGNWDFLKACLGKDNTAKNNRKDAIGYLGKLGKTGPEAEKLYLEARLISPRDLDKWVSPRMNIYGGIANAKENSGIALFDNGVVYNPKEKAAYFYSARDNKYKIPQSLFIPENGELKEIPYPGKELDFSLLITKTEKGYQAVLLDRELAGSVFVRLYFLNGLGLKYFKPCINEEKAQDKYLRVFKIEWEQ